MPYKKYNKTYKKRSVYKKSRASRYIGYTSSALSIASKALAVSYGIKKLLNVEYKFHDIVSSVAPGTAPAIIQLTNIPQGDTDVTRDGAQVKLTSILVRYLYRQHPSSLIDFLRIMIVHDKQTNQSIYNINDLLEASGATTAMNSPLNLDNKYRFHVLYNQVHAMSINGKRCGNKEFMKEISLRIRFDNSTPAISDLTSSSLSLVIITIDNTNKSSIDIFTRIRYIDN